ncbi:MAG: DNA polymerase III subunit gamma/tau [Spirochaetales bacterium]|uniref:DNA polymerase III subunit gamma/tau n=1 Tax=Candidatus Thalassospirochaeta sargassi TaxID=3119039 RepID=A0AAJ1IEY6_9SPIO|nr:DNA polymerase III subunit gamma/tau [Spirochaetales bacterium]
MAYEVTATRRRPGMFEDLIGQEFVVSTIKNSIKAGRIAHAYLFSGPRGVGKTSAARILARAVNCEEGPTPTPCGVCNACTEITRGNALDVIEIDGASNTSVNDIREIKDEVLFAPNTCRYKVYIIDEVHMLSTSAFNALLKTIEEPPPYVIFIFATTEIHKVPATIRSRCQQFNFRLISLEEIKNSLMTAAAELKIEAEDDALFWIAKEATGSMRDAYTLFDQVAAFSDGLITLEKIREKLGLVGLDSMNAIVEAMCARNSADVIDLSSGIIAGGVSIEQFAVDLAEYFRSLLFIRCGIEKESLLGYARSRYSEKTVSAFSKTQLEKALEIIFRFYREVRYSINPRFELELMLSQLSDLSAWVSPADVADRLEALKRAIASGEVELKEPSTAQSEPAEQQASPAPNPAPAAMKSAPEPEPEPEVETEPAHTAPAAASEGPHGLSADERNAVLDAIRKKKLTLAASVDQAVGWRQTEESMSFSFENAYQAAVVKNDRNLIKDAIQEVTGRSFAIEVEVVQTKSAGSADEEQKLNKQVDAVKKVFRGEIIQGGN